MKCFECKKKINSATMVHYLQVDFEGVPISEQVRDICNDCFPLLQFNSNHYVISESPRKTTLKLNIKKKVKKNNS